VTCPDAATRRPAEIRDIPLFRKGVTVFSDLMLDAALGILLFSVVAMVAVIVVLLIAL
jgi:hypothetical protein